MIDAKYVAHILALIHRRWTIPVTNDEYVLWRKDLEPGDNGCRENFCCFMCGDYQRRVFDISADILRQFIRRIFIEEGKEGKECVSGRGSYEHQPTKV